VLTNLVASLPLAELVDSLLPTTAPTIRAELAEVLLRVGDFAGRETVLARLAARAPVPLTVNDQIALTHSAVQVERRDDGCHVHVELAFANGPPAPMVLRCDGPGAAIYRSFETAERYRWTFHLDPAFPPGDYELSLDFRADAPHFPFGRVAVAGSALRLDPDRRLPATNCYWTTAEPGRRIHAADSIPLRSGDLVWRDVEVVGAARDLLLRTRTATRLAIWLDDRALAPAAATFTRSHRVTLPANARGRLTIAAVGDDAPELQELAVVPGSKP
jgi:hypothetical protein